MSQISILIAATSTDIKADAIIGLVNHRRDMQLVDRRIFSAKATDTILELLPNSDRCVLVLVGKPNDTDTTSQTFLDLRASLIILRVDIVGGNVHIVLRDPPPEDLLEALHDLADRIGRGNDGRTTRVQIETEKPPVAGSAGETKAEGQESFLQAGFNWIKAVLFDAVGQVGDDNGEMRGFSLNRFMLLRSLDSTPARVFANRTIDAALHSASVEASKRNEPLAVVARVFQLTLLDLKLLLLVLAPELDNRFQRCFGFLLDDMSRRVGTMALFCKLLGVPPVVCTRLAQSSLVRWLAYENRTFSADEPLRLDPYLSQWILGNRGALQLDPRVRRAIRLQSWQGADVLDSPTERATSAELLQRIQGLSESRWLILSADDPANWRALIELGARNRKPSLSPIRVEAARLAGIDAIDLEEVALRIARMALLSREPLVIDSTNRDGSDAVGDYVEPFLAALDSTGCRAALICHDDARIVRQMGSAKFEIMTASPLSSAGHVASVRRAARATGAFLTSEAAESVSNRYPLSIDGIEHAMRLAASRPTDEDCNEALIQRFIAACRELAVDGVSNLAERIEPIFRMEDVVLPSNQKRQLAEIVDHVRLAPKVLDGWKFGAQLPYGRGVTALFFGPSGTGKTMAAMGIAQTLGIQLLRVDLSRVVSKYIGDTEKNIDRVFNDAKRSGSAILIDEADALLGKRSEVNDAHDRYANIEVAYLLQRMETYEGLAILTTNMRQNLDSAFLRRLRFVVDFPRPDAEARETIWRFCLPEDSYDLDDSAFRQLARKVDLTGGHIRQITLRAAFIAAAADERINLNHIAQATRAEYDKLGLPAIEVDLNADRRAA